MSEQDESKVRGIMSMIDRGFELNKIIKDFNDEMEVIKSNIRQHAKASKNQYIKGTKGKVTVGDYTSSIIDPSKAYEELGNNLEKLFAVVKVNSGSLKTYLGNKIVDRITSKKTQRYHTVKFYEINEHVDFKNGRKTRKMDI